MEHLKRLKQIMSTQHFLMRDLEFVQDLELPNWCIAAGYVRNHVWDDLHGFKTRATLNDVDVLYYDSSDLDEQSEKHFESILKGKRPDYNWSCKNQARMHIRNQANPYTSVENAMLYWPETATAIGIRLDENHHLEVIAPHGLNDLFDLVIRRSPYFYDKEYFLKRVYSKGWLDRWPKLQLIED